MTVPYIHADWSTFKTGIYGQPLSDVVELLIEENRNGAFELQMQYPVDGAYASLIATDAIISSSPSMGASPEPFRVYSITRDIVGLITVHARHIVYDLDGCIIEPFSVTTLDRLPNALNTHYNSLFGEFEVVISGYTSPDHITIDYTTLVPKTLWSILGDLCSVLRGYGCELSYQWDSYYAKEVITLNKARGTDNKAIIAYGYNLLSMRGSIDNESVYTAIYPYYYRWIFGQPVEYVELPEKTISTGAAGRTRILPVSFSSEFSDPPTDAQLRSAANSYVAQSDWSVHNDVSLDFVPLQNTTDFENAPNQAISLCDRVTVSADVIGVTLASKVIRTVYNPLINKYAEITVGTKTDDLADTIVNIERDLNNIEDQARFAAYNGGVS